MNNEASDNRQPAPDEASSTGELRLLQLVRAGSVQFGVFADEIATIVPWKEPTPLPHAAKSVLGVVSVQGRMLTVLELTTLAGGDPIPSDAVINGDRRIVALRGDEQLALAVDAVGNAVRIGVLDIRSQQDNASTLILGSLRIDQAETNILNARELFPAAIQGRERRRRRF